MKVVTFGQKNSCLDYSVQSLIHWRLCFALLTPAMASAEFTAEEVRAGRKLCPYLQVLRGATAETGDKANV